jgi:hypothetical protein
MEIQFKQIKYYNITKNNGVLQKPQQLEVPSLSSGPADMHAPRAASLAQLDQRLQLPVRGRRDAAE